MDETADPSGGVYGGDEVTGAEVVDFVEFRDFTGASAAGAMDYVGDAGEGGRQGFGGGNGAGADLDGGEVGLDEGFVGSRAEEEGDGDIAGAEGVEDVAADEARGAGEQHFHGEFGSGFRWVLMVKEGGFYSLTLMYKFLRVKGIGPVFVGDGRAAFRYKGPAVRYKG